MNFKAKFEDAAEDEDFLSMRSSTEGSNGEGFVL